MRSHRLHKCGETYARGAAAVKEKANAMYTKAGLLTHIIPISVSNLLDRGFYTVLWLP